MPFNSGSIIDPKPFETYFAGLGAESGGGSMWPGESMAKPDGTGFNWKGAAASGIGAGVSLLASHFAPKTRNVNDEVNQIEDQSKALHRTGSSLVNQGESALNPVLQYFAALAKGDPQALLQATQPERARVMDQYDTARRSTATFGPRGGGQASSMNESRIKEATALASTTNAARAHAADSAAQIGETLTGQGLTAESAATQAMAQVLGPILQQRGQDKASIAAQFAGYAEMIAPFVLMAL